MNSIELYFDREEIVFKFSPFFSYLLAPCAPLITIPDWEVPVAGAAKLRAVVPIISQSIAVDHKLP
jgi:hypothetical protein